MIESKGPDAVSTTPSPPNATSGAQERADAAAQPTIDIYAQIIERPKPIAPTTITSVDVDDDVIRAVDTYYDTLESARQALLETLYQKGFEVFFNGMWAQKAIGRITRKMAILRLKREQLFHKWTTDQVKEYAPYWKELITPSFSTLKRFCEAENIDAYMTPRYKINITRAVRRVYDIIGRRNHNVNITHNDDLESHIESVVNAYVDNFAIGNLTRFLNNIYHKILRKEPTDAPVDTNVGVDVDTDTDYVIQTVRHIMQKRAKDKRKRALHKERKRAEEERKRAEEERKRAEDKRKRALHKERKRLEEEERKRLEEEERKRLEEEERKRLEEEERKRAEEEAKRAEEERKRLEEEQRKRLEEEQRKRAEEKRKRAEEKRKRALQNGIVKLRDTIQRQRQRKRQGTGRSPTEYGQTSGTVAPAEAEPQGKRNSTIKKPKKKKPKKKKPKKDNKPKGGIN